MAQPIHNGKMVRLLTGAAGREQDRPIIIIEGRVLLAMFNNAPTAWEMDHGVGCFYCVGQIASSTELHPICLVRMLEHCQNSYLAGKISEGMSTINQWQCFLLYDGTTVITRSHHTMSITAFAVVVPAYTTSFLMMLNRATQSAKSL